MLHLIRFQGLDSRTLNRSENPGIDIGLDLSKGIDNLGIPHDKADSPSSHVKGLRERMELDSQRFRSLHFKEASRPVPLIGDLRIGCVMADDDFVFRGEFDDLFEKLGVCDSPGGIIRVIDKKEYGLLTSGGRDS